MYMIGPLRIFLLWISLSSLFVFAFISGRIVIESMIEVAPFPLFPMINYWQMGIITFLLSAVTMFGFLSLGPDGSDSGTKDGPGTYGP